MAEMAKGGKRAMLMVDCIEYLQALSKMGQRYGVEILACVEVDMANRPLGATGPHLGLRRSPLRQADKVLALARSARSLPNVRINTVMGYEGHIAGTNDAVPGGGLKNTGMRLIKGWSVKELSGRRDEVVRAARRGISAGGCEWGGSGSLVSTLADSSVTEVTVGSGFYCSALFHHFAEVYYRPAAFFATQVVRKPALGMVTCLGGGYPASGPAGEEKIPLPVLPVGLHYLPLEGAGEVQTPLALPPGGPVLSLGAPVFFQHAKAGELCKRLNELLLVRNQTIIGRVLRYLHNL